jgi:acyl-CoA reductase-like NAD-dependent aldehyde dehydrogenase
VPYEHRIATPAEVEESLASARGFAPHWASVPPEDRIATLRRVADELAARAASSCRPWCSTEASVPRKPTPR